MTRCGCDPVVYHTAFGSDAGTHLVHDEGCPEATPLKASQEPQESPQDVHQAQPE